MSVPATADDLVLLIRKSGLVDERKLTAFLDSHQSDGVLTSEPKKVVAIMVREGLLTYFQGEQYLLGKWRGFTLGKFKLLERIGVGGMGQVFLCEHTFMRKRMAVKVLPPTKAEDPVSLGRFYREARVASGLEHPNIVRTYDIDQDGPLHFLVMEYMDGTSLFEIVKRFGPMSIARACHYIRQACVGLQYAHSRGMIHRDIKPGNILVDRQGVAKLLDMGYARFYRDEQDQLTLKYDDKNVLGTADYVAPEQTRDSRDIDIRADIYGMGATFYYLLTGQPPFPEATLAEKLKAHQSKQPTSIRELRSEIPQGVARIVEKMMAKDPKERYQTPQEVVDALEIWTQEAIDPPSAEEMPKLSPAATEPTFATAKNPAPPPPLLPAPRPTRESARTPPSPSAPVLAPRSREITPTTPTPVSPPQPAQLQANEKAAPSPIKSRPELALPDKTERDVEEGATVPVPPSMRPMFAAPKPPSPEKMDDEVDASENGSAEPRPVSAPAETRSISAASQATPRAGSLRALTAPESPRRVAPDVGDSHLAQTLPATPPPALRPTPPPAPADRSAAPKSAPAVELPKLRSFHGAVPTPKADGGPVRSPAPMPAKAPSLESYRVQPPRPASPGDISRSPAAKPIIAPPKPNPMGLSTTPIRRPLGSSNVPLGRSAVPAPAYKPPTRVPYFDQPIGPQNPKFLPTLGRWFLIVLISSLIGIALGGGIWFQFLHRKM